MRYPVYFFKISNAIRAIIIALFYYDRFLIIFVLCMVADPPDIRDYRDSHDDSPRAVKNQRSPHPAAPLVERTCI